MSSLLRALVCILLVASLATAETITVVSPDLSLIIKNSAPTAVEATETPNAATVNKWDGQAYEIAIPADVDRFDNQIAELRSLSMVAGAEFTFTQQMRIGEIPAPFAAGLWPTAEFRTARSPYGSVLVTYTTTIDDAEQAIWSNRLTAAQTAVLVGKTGVTELSFSDAEGIYTVRHRIPTTVLHHITEEAN